MASVEAYKTQKYKYMAVQTPFDKISIKPCWRQLIIEQLLWLILCIALVAAYLLTSFMFHGLLLLLAVLVAACIFYQMVCFSRIEYIVTGEQIVYLHGVLMHQTDYMELYRVVDYQQHRSLLQQLTGLKTITIMSGDRNLPCLDIIGVEEQEEVVQEIRTRVEYNKQMKHIHEITNRM